MLGVVYLFLVGAEGHKQSHPFSILGSGVWRFRGMVTLQILIVEGFGPSLSGFRMLRCVSRPKGTGWSSSRGASGGASEEGANGYAVGQG